MSNTADGALRFELEVDACGLKCPMPILRTKKALANLSSGQVVKVLATDTNAVGDFEAFARQTGNTLLSQSESNGVYTFFLRRR
jgi:tRNA 2-thiouridine synthesizing protein A